MYQRQASVSGRSNSLLGRPHVALGSVLPPVPVLRAITLVGKYKKSSTTESPDKVE